MIAKQNMIGLRPVSYTHLTHLLPGTMVQVLGPLGNGFDLSLAPKRALLVAGGVGVAPLLPLTEVLIQQGCEVTVLLGFTHGADLVGDKKLARLGAEVQIVTVDGTQGLRGVAPDYICLLYTSTTLTVGQLSARLGYQGKLGLLYLTILMFVGDSYV